ncbi:hypothetical protein NDI54_12905 [Haloarcula sp. S1AR25-5A]|uniref:Uncharacterized protein n=1 Tax=Haloarcula terrestris TaxID=2950533 RepID=A0AAE4EZH7_9EURY|nr:hypothetical protein [Haloarcula terrestris]MDS0222249.1 hypothetical protein [Haloarcula terrestris]
MAPTRSSYVLATDTVLTRSARHGGNDARDVRSPANVAETGSGGDDTGCAGIADPEEGGG